MLPGVERPEEIRARGTREAIGAALKALREAEGRTQTEVGWEMRVSDKTIGRIEHGFASFEMIDRYLAALGKTIEDLLGSTATPPYRGGKPAAPPGRHLEVVTEPAARRASSSVGPASGLGPKPVVSQPISVDGVTPLDKRSRPHVRRSPSAAGRR